VSVNAFRVSQRIQVLDWSGGMRAVFLEPRAITYSMRQTRVAPVSNVRVTHRQPG
jgi:hypothetical protein